MAYNRSLAMGLGGNEGKISKVVLVLKKLVEAEVAVDSKYNTFKRVCDGLFG